MRRRTRAAVRKRRSEAAHAVAQGIYAIGCDIEQFSERELWWRAPIQYVGEYMAQKVSEEHGLGERYDEVAAYLVLGLGRVVANVAYSFDREHFEDWAREQRERMREGGADAQASTEGTRPRERS